MLKQKSFVKLSSKKSKIGKVVKEHYLRDDIPCGFKGCPKCSILHSTIFSTTTLLDPNHQLMGTIKWNNYPSFVVVPDTNIIVHHWDTLLQRYDESPFFPDIIILQIVLQEVESIDKELYKRVRAKIANPPPNQRFFVFSNEHHNETYPPPPPSPTEDDNDSEVNESPNDRNDRAIRIATSWYRLHVIDLFPSCPIVLLSNDRLNRLLSIKNDSDVSSSNLLSFSLSSFCSLFEGNPKGPLSLLKDQTSPLPPLSKELLTSLNYPPYLKDDELESGLRSGRLLQGKLTIIERVNSPRHSIAKVTLRNRKSGQVITVSLNSHLSINRAVHGDQVVCQAITTSGTPSITNDTLILSSTHEGELRSREDEGDDVDNSCPSMDNDEHESMSYQVVGIRKRSIRAYCGSILPKTLKDGWGLFMSLDSKIPLILLKATPSLKGRRLQLRIDDWYLKSKYPTGHVVIDLGEAGIREVEGRMILLEHEIQNEPWSSSVMACLPSPDWKVPSECFGNNRKDFTSLPLVSIDPPGCTDIDDALHACYLPSGEIEVGVHIADVTYFVEAESALDLEAQRRGTTVYLVDDRIDMLPPVLGSNLCSLQEGKERLAFSVIWRIMKGVNGHPNKVIETKFYRSVIKSRSSFTYADAQAILDGEKVAPSADVKESLELLLSLSKEMRSQRMDNGSLNLSSVELRFLLERDENGKIDKNGSIGLEIKEALSTNHLVEEWMLAANCAVAKRIEEYFPTTAILRRHPAPSPSSFLMLNEMLRRRGLDELVISSSKTLNDSLNSCQIEGDPLFNKVVRCLVTRSMYQAKYFSSGTVDSSEYWHYGLACPIYTHFTSPIRRYADVMVHRLLGAILVLDNDAMSEGVLPMHQTQVQSKNLGIYWDTQGLDDICANLNYRHTMAQHAQRSSSEVYTHLFLKGNGGEEIEEDAYMIGVGEDGDSIRVLLPKYGIENEISIDTSLFYVCIDKQQLIKKGKEDGIMTNMKIRLFDSIRVAIRVDNIEDSAKRERILLRMIL